MAYCRRLNLPRVADINDPLSRVIHPGYSARPGAHDPLLQAVFRGRDYPAASRRGVGSVLARYRPLQRRLNQAAATSQPRLRRAPTTAPWSRFSPHPHRGSSGTSGTTPGRFSAALWRPGDAQETLWRPQGLPHRFQARCGRCDGHCNGLLETAVDQGCDGPQIGVWNRLRDNVDSTPRQPV